MLFACVGAPISWHKVCIDSVVTYLGKRVAICQSGARELPACSVHRSGCGRGEMHPWDPEDKNQEIPGVPRVAEAQR